MLLNQRMWPPWPQSKQQLGQRKEKFSENRTGVSWRIVHTLPWSWRNPENNLFNYLKWYKFIENGTMCILRLGWFFLISLPVPIWAWSSNTHMNIVHILLVWIRIWRLNYAEIYLARVARGLFPWHLIETANIFLRNKFFKKILTQSFKPRRGFLAECWLSLDLIWL